MHPLAQILRQAAVRPPVAGNPEDELLDSTYQSDWLDELITPIGSDLVEAAGSIYHSKGRSLPEEEKEEQKGQQMPPPVTKPRTPETDERLRKLRKELGQKAVAGGISAPDSDEWAERGPWSTESLPDEAIFSIPGLELLDSEFQSTFFPEQGDSIADTTYENPFPDIQGSSIMQIVKEKGGNWIGEDAADFSFVNPKQYVDIFKHTPSTDTAALDDLLEEYDLYSTGNVNYSDINEELLATRDMLNELEQYQDEMGVTDWSDEINSTKDKITDLEIKAEFNDWADTKLLKYITTEMGTMNDPVRKMAREGKYHIQGNIHDMVEEQQDPRAFVNTLNTAEEHREAAGMPAMETGEHYNALHWETATDAMIDTTTSAEKYITEAFKSGMSIPDWMYNIDPKTPFYSVDSVGDLGIPHVRDELYNAMRSNSGLPDDLKIKPGKLGKMSVADVFSRAADINDWRARNIAKADHEKAFNGATFPMSGFQYPNVSIPESDKLEYDKRSAKDINADLQWVEIRDSRDPEYSSPIDELQQALQYEGGVMAHCVSGYCSGVRGNKQKIFSLRDETGLPHITIETSNEIDEQEVDRVLRTAYMNGELIEDFGYERAATERNYLNEYLQDRPLKITQVKGWHNKLALDNYVPMIQDFVFKHDAEFVHHPKGYDTYGIGDIEAARLYQITDNPIDRFDGDLKTRERINVLARDYDNDFVNELTVSYIIDEVGDILAGMGKKLFTDDDLLEAIKAVDINTRVK